MSAKPWGFNSLAVTAPSERACHAQIFFGHRKIKNSKTIGHRLFRQPYKT
jgi:hypothetical protein